jgi:putative hydrolase of the HAD superfamily
MTIATSPIFPTPRAVVFDLGEVLATPDDLYGAIALRLSRQHTAIEAAYWAHRDDYDRGASSLTFWSAVLDQVGIAAHEDLVHDLTQIDTEAWTTLRADATSLLTDLSDKGIRVGVLSNATLDMAVAARETEWADYVTDWFFSSELKLAKPDPAIYRHVTEELGLPAGSIVFIDDRQVNVNAALDAGWNAHLWTSGANTRKLLEQVGLL